MSESDTPQTPPPNAERPDAERPDAEHPDVEHPDAAPPEDETSECEAQAEDPTSPLRGFDDLEQAEAPSDEAGGS